MTDILNYTIGMSHNKILVSESKIEPAVGAGLQAIVQRSIRLSVRPCVRQTRYLLQNERNFCANSYIT